MKPILDLVLLFRTVFAAMRFRPEILGIVRMPSDLQGNEVIFLVVSRMYVPPTLLNDLGVFELIRIPNRRTNILRRDAVADLIEIRCQDGARRANGIGQAAA